MAKISRPEIEYLAALSRIQLDPEAADRLTVELGGVVGFVDALVQTDTSGVPTTSQVTGLEDVWREDAVTTSPESAAKLLQNAPQTKDGYIKVRRVK